MPSTVVLTPPPHTHRPQALRPHGGANQVLPSVRSSAPAQRLLVGTDPSRASVLLPTWLNLRSLHLPPGPTPAPELPSPPPPIYSLPLDTLHIPPTMEVGRPLPGKMAQPRVPRDPGAELQRAHRHEPDTAVTGHTKWPAEHSLPQISSGKNTSLTRGNVQHFMEPRVGSDPGDHLLWHLLCTGKLRPGDEWGFPRPQSQEVAEPVSRSSARLSLPPSSGHVRAQLNFTPSKDPSSFTAHPTSARLVLVCFPCY